MNMPFLPSGRALCVSPILSYCSSHTDGICAFLLSPSTSPSLCRIWHSCEMGLVCHSYRTSHFGDEQDKHQSIWQQKAVSQLLKSSLLGLISPLLEKLQPLSFSESSQFISLVIFNCPDLLNH